MNPAEARPFRLDDPLPTGTSVLEASAGTGKTFVIAALAARFVAEAAVPIDRLALLTFNRSAAKELKGRVRERLVHAAEAMAGPGSQAVQEEVLRVIGDCDDRERRRRHDRLRRAVADFDTAAIGTIHEFSTRAMAVLGMAGDSDRSERFDDSPSELVDDVVEALYLTGFVGAGGQTFPPAAARPIARAATAGDPSALLLPMEPQDASVAARVAFAHGSRRELATRRRRLGRSGYDDRLNRLRDVLSGPGGDAALSRLRERVGAVLVDEFQDTDPVQWEILRAIADGHLPLVLIGDPKQAIYAFRGADVATYLSASARATEHRTLSRNWRSDPEVVRGVGMLLAGARLGDDRIAVRPVEPARSGRRLTQAGPPLRVRVLDREGQPTQTGLRHGVGTEGDIAEDLGDQVVTLLDGPGRVLADSGMPRPVRPGDVAVLVRTGAQADRVRAALEHRAVPAVVASFRDVFQSPAAGDWLAVLDAVDQPGRPDVVRTAAATTLLGLLEAVGADQVALDALTGRLPSLREVWRERGALALLDALMQDGLSARLAGRQGGDRLLTDVRHVADVLQATASNDRLSTLAQREWLREQRRTSVEDEARERSRRLETDAQAVQVMTVHAAKGLEFPIVMLPYAAFGFAPRQPPEAFGLHLDGRRALFVGGESADRSAAWRQHQAEQAGEALRTLYVALTRASSQVIAWWAPARGVDVGPLHRVVFGLGSDGSVPESVPVPMEDEDALSRWGAVAARSDGHLVVERVERPGVPGSRRRGGPVLDAPRLEVARFDRSLDLAWRRTSYSGLTAAVAHEVGPMSEPEGVGTVDEPADATHVAPPGAVVADTPWSRLPAGAAFGTLVHDVLDGLDPAAVDLREVLGERVAAALALGTVDGVDPDTLTAGLRGALTTPLGVLAGGLRHCDIPRGDRLSELVFELPMAGGDQVGVDRSCAVLADVATVLRHRLAPADPLAAYPDRLAAGALGGQQLRGYLLGSIDAVLRVPHPRVPGEHTHLVVDYKTNVLRDAAGAVTLAAYRPEALAEAMMTAHYPLQALLYSVALHRFLRWRLGDYDPDVHLGGVQYHFVRGMVGPASLLAGADGEPSGEVAGLLEWALPQAAVLEVSDLLAGGGRS